MGINNFTGRQLITGNTGLELILADCEKEFTSLHKMYCALSPRGRRALKFYEKLAKTVRDEIVRQSKLPERNHE